MDLQQLLHLNLFINFLFLALNLLLIDYSYLTLFSGDQIAYLELQLIALLLGPVVGYLLFLRVERLDLDIELASGGQFLQLADDLVPVLLLVDETSGFRLKFSQSFGDTDHLSVALLHSYSTDIMIVVNFLGLLGVLPDGCLEVLPALDLMEGLQVFGLR